MKTENLKRKKPLREKGLYTLKYVSRKFILA